MKENLVEVEKDLGLVWRFTFQQDYYYFLYIISTELFFLYIFENKNEEKKCSLQMCKTVSNTPQQNGGCKKKINKTLTHQVDQ